jgi:hypothetical protein
MLRHTLTLLRTTFPASKSSPSRKARAPAKNPTMDGNPKINTNGIAFLVLDLSGLITTIESIFFFSRAPQKSFLTLYLLDQLQEFSLRKPTVARSTSPPAFAQQLKSRVGLPLATVAVLLITLNLDGTPIIFYHTHSSHSQTSRLLTSSLSLGVPVPRGTQCM